MPDLEKVYAEFKKNMLEHKREWYKFLISWCDGYFTFIRENGFVTKEDHRLLVCYGINQMFGQILHFGTIPGVNNYTNPYSFRKLRNYSLPQKKSSSEDKRDEIFKKSLQQNIVLKFELAKAAQGVKYAHTLAQEVFKKELPRMDEIVCIEQLGHFAEGFANKHQKPTKSPKDLFREYAGDRGRVVAPLYYSARINKLKFETDFDHVEGATLEDALSDSTRICDEFNKRARIYFSGNRGFHIYVDLKQEDIGWTMMRYFNDDLLKVRRFPTVDRPVSYRISQPMRLPYTPHPKSGRFCIPINPNWSLNKIISTSENVPIPQPIIKKPVQVCILRR